MELRAEVDRQKTVMAELETQRQGIVAERTALSEISQNTQQLQRNAARAEEKLAQLRKQAQVRFFVLFSCISFLISLHACVITRSAGRIPNRQRRTCTSS